MALVSPLVAFVQLVDGSALAFVSKVHITILLRSRNTRLSGYALAVLMTAQRSGSSDGVSGYAIQCLIPAFLHADEPGSVYLIEVDWTRYVKDYFLESSYYFNFCSCLKEVYISNCLRYNLNHALLLIIAGGFRSGVFLVSWWWVGEMCEPLCDNKKHAERTSD